MSVILPTAIIFRRISTTSSYWNQNKKIKDLLLGMTKDREHLQKIRMNRKQKKNLGAKYAPGVVKLQVLGNGAPGHPSCLYLFTDSNRYLFNCGEGTQRLAHEYKVKLGTLEHIFTTGSTWEKIGGLPGAALTIQDIGVPALYLHGPPGLGKLFEATRRFVVLKELDIHVVDSTVDTVHDDHAVRIEAITLSRSADCVDSESDDNPNESGTPGIGEDDDTDYYSDIKGVGRNMKIINEKGPKRSKSLGTYTDVIEDTAKDKKVLCYICQPKPKEGTLLVEKCVEKGVPPGPLLGKLKSGEDITLENGNIVRAVDVRSPDCPGPIFIVVDCPSEEYIDSLIENPVWADYQKSSDEQRIVHLVVHFTPKNMLNHPKYVKWMEGFHRSTKHMILNDMCGGIASESVIRVQYKLNMLDEQIFPLIRPSTQELEPRKTDVVAQVPTIFGETMMQYSLRPECDLDVTSQVEVTPEAYIKETMRMEQFPEELEKFKSLIKDFKPNTNQFPGTSEFPHILFLGTGSSIPNKTRNVSGILVHTSPDSYILLDCGEGTSGQITRFYGVTRATQIFSQLKAIYVSHLHADHHLGLMTLLKERQKAFQSLQLPFTPVILIAPQQIMSWLHLYNKSFERIKHLFELAPSTRFQNSGEDVKSILSHLNLESLETDYVVHCKHSFGVALKHKDGWKMAYSGDTMPSEALIKIGKDSDILIHEATLEDDLKQEAILKQHSTTSEAIEVGKRMGAKFTLLTHFSQRYAKVPVITKDFDNSIGIAFDNMSICARDLPKLPMLYPPLKAMFAEECDMLEQKKLKKQRKREREQQNAESNDHAMMTGSS